MAGRRSSRDDHPTGVSPRPCKKINARRFVDAVAGGVVVDDMARTTNLVVVVVVTEEETRAAARAAVRRFTANGMRIAAQNVFNGGYIGLPFLTMLFAGRALRFIE
jgi:hypothetical protein